MMSESSRECLSIHPGVYPFSFLQLYSSNRQNLNLSLSLTRSTAGGPRNDSNVTFGEYTYWRFPTATALLPPAARTGADASAGSTAGRPCNLIGPAAGALAGGLDTALGAGAGRRAVPAPAPVAVSVSAVALAVEVPLVEPTGRRGMRCCSLVPAPLVSFVGCAAAVIGFGFSGWRGVLLTG